MTLEALIPKQHRFKKMAIGITNPNAGYHTYFSENLR